MEVYEINNEGNPSATITPSASWLNTIRDRCNRVKTLFCNKGFTIGLLSLAGYITCREQFLGFEYIQNRIDKDMYWIILSCGVKVIVPVFGGLLSCAYPAHIVLAVSVFFSSTLSYTSTVIIVHFVNDFESVSTVRCYLKLLIEGTSLVGATAFHGVWASCAQLSSIRHHVPLVLFTLYHFGYIRLMNVGSGSLDGVIVTIKNLGVNGLFWFGFYVLYLAYSRFNARNATSADYSAIIIRRPTMPERSHIPWKSILRSRPVIAIIMAYVCLSNHWLFETLSRNEPLKIYHDGYPDGYSQTSIVLTSMCVIIFSIVIIEFFPEIHIFSTGHVRKFWCSAYFTLNVIYYCLMIYRDSEKSDHNLRSFLGILFAIHVFNCFGFHQNHLDISPRYASLLFGIFLSFFYGYSGLSKIQLWYLMTDYENYILTKISIIVMNIHSFIYYIHFASAEFQPWDR